MDYSCAAWDGLHDHLKDVPWEDIFKLFLLLLQWTLSNSNSQGEFEFVQIMESSD